MTHDEAQRRTAELNRDHADRHATRWLTRECEDGWEVVRVRLPAGVRIDPLTETAEAKPRPPEASDPRPAFIRNVGGPYAV
jgi:hypothetical protein